MLYVLFCFVLLVCVFVLFLFWFCFVIGMSEDARGDVMDMLEEALGDVKGTVEELGMKAEQMHKQFSHQGLYNHADPCRIPF